MTLQQNHPAERLVTRARTLGRTVRRVLDDNLDHHGARGLPAARLTPATALRENGFVVYRGLFTAAEAARLAAGLKREAGVVDGRKHVASDATNRYAKARELLFEGRILDAVASALAEQPKFLQVGDLHYRHDAAGWHRDSVHRAHDASRAPDWTDSSTPFGVVKAIVYLETENAAMGLMAGSHASPHEIDRERVQGVENAGGQLVIGPHDEPNRRLTATEQATPIAWQAQVGDVLVFDERTFHCGRRVEHGRVAGSKQAPKFTLSLVFGRDNHHSERMYSYFRYARGDLFYRDLDAGFRDELAARDLVLSRGWSNFYTDQPAELRHVWLPDPATMDELIGKFSGAPW